MRRPLTLLLLFLPLVFAALPLLALWATSLDESQPSVGISTHAIIIPAPESDVPSHGSVAYGMSDTPQPCHDQSDLPIES